jgi:hypothetical protein
VAYTVEDLFIVLNMQYITLMPSVDSNAILIFLAVAAVMHMQNGLVEKSNVCVSLMVLFGQKSIVFGDI